jgi:hypothetical protein
MPTEKTGRFSRWTVGQPVKSSLQQRLYERGVLEALQVEYDYTLLLPVIEIKHI